VPQHEFYSFRGYKKLYSIIHDARIAERIAERIAKTASVKLSPLLSKISRTGAATYTAVVVG
jgi:hypothetical protein